MTTPELPYLLLPRRQDAHWPRGWWKQPHRGARLGCCGGPGHGHKIAPGHRMFLTGEPGEVFCTLHAPGEEVDRLAKTTAPIRATGVHGRSR